MRAIAKIEEKYGEGITVYVDEARDEVVLRSVDGAHRFTRDQTRDLSVALLESNVTLNVYAAEQAK